MTGEQDASVICLHGHRPMLGTIHLLAGSLRRAGYAVRVPRYDSRHCAFPAIVDDIERDIRHFLRDRSGAVHFVGYSLGGLVIRALLARWRPETLGRVVMIGTPNHGSEWADWCVHRRIGDRILGPVEPYLVTRRLPSDDALLGSVSYPLGVIAGDTSLRRFVPSLLPRPNDGTVSVASTHVIGETDHIVLPVTHAIMPANRAVQKQVRAFLRDGHFVH